MSNDFEDQIAELVQENWDEGVYEHEFYIWCLENMIHKDDAPDYEEDFMQMKFEELMEKEASD